MSPLSIHGKKTGKVPTHFNTLWRQQYMRCHYCNRMTDLGTGRPNGYTATVEHVLPRCRGGSKGIENKVVSCARCNLMRNMIEQRLQGNGRWSDIDVPVELFLKLLPVDINRWSVYNRKRLGEIVERMRWGQ